ncbi:MAG: 2-hydroxyacyl-CoA dehydratase [Zoogloeaceae bacterium]|jgi:predicted CoA-substrate-specific enzyme activase|nr:2-hydroxyacyl-CoA dehydratase [Zoogloeaceae bacterium]
MDKKLEHFTRIGVDMGSTTVKVVVLDKAGNPVFKSYTRHFSEARQTAARCLRAAVESGALPPASEVSVVLTGSGGVSVAGMLGLPFEQEVIACAKAIEARAPQTDVAIELGGEDAKITFLTNGVEQRMNGSCAGGTGAFIDQMATLLKTDALGLNDLASRARNLYPIAARCGVFAKTDVQPLLNEGVPREDIALSILQAVAHQTISGLACGRKIRGNIAFLGGPLNFLPELKNRFIATLTITPEHQVQTEDSELFVAIGAALHGKAKDTRPCAEVLAAFEQLATRSETSISSQRAFFLDAAERQAFYARHEKAGVKRGNLESYRGATFLGIDGGSTTTKAALIGENGELLYTHYGSNEGNPVKIVGGILQDVYDKLPEGASIAASSVTGYGEALIREAFKLDHSEVETIAHYKAAEYFLPGVDFILDIGGQDMKCLRVKDGVIDSILLNEACSSGCGSFIETFAQSVGLPIDEFARAALESRAPSDLGSRCTVFMNSSVKQAQKEGASVADISAGLSYAVIKNALIKVIKIKSPEDLGQKIIVQGGTFYNDSVLRAFELISGREAVRPDIAGLMGEFGSALIAKERWQGQAVSSMLPADDLQSFAVRHSLARCKLCANTCAMTVNRFSDGRKFISGNRCERGLGKQKTANDLPDLYAYKYERVFAYEAKKDAPRGVIGVPRALNMFENYPLWFTFLTELGFEARLSAPSSKALLEQGLDTLPSDTVCYPAKLVHGHIVDLVQQGVKRIFYPCIPYEQKEFADSDNHFNCPVVTSYPELIRNNVDYLKESGVVMLHPFLSLADEKKLARQLTRVFPEIAPAAIRRALAKGWAEQARMKADIARQGEMALDYLRATGKHGIILAGRPYHIDPEIHHGIPQIVTTLGMAVLTEDSVAHLGKLDAPLRVVDQWTYHARLYRAAALAARERSLDVIHLNSFGCGLDSIAVDQVQEILVQHGKIYTGLKIDEGSNLGAARIRIRSLKAALAERGNRPEAQIIHFHPRSVQRVPFTREMSGEYTILAPQMSPIHFQFMEPAFKACGYRLKVLENATPEAIDQGLRFVNNDACFPSILVVGQLVEALQSGAYDLNKTAVMISQTGGGCRATNYIAYLRKALADSGFGGVPVISLNAVGMEKNDGFKLGFALLNRLMMCVAYGDLLMHVLFRTRPYEQEAGAANALYASWVVRCKEAVFKGSFRHFRRNIHDIVQDFDRIPLTDEIKPRIGLVGEILVKFNPGANNDIVQIIEKEGGEAVMPGLMDFLLYCACDYDYNHRTLSHSKLAAIAGNLAVKAMDFYRRDMRKALAASVRFTPPPTIDHLARCAEPFLSRGNQSGEGWFLPGEMVELIETGVPNIVCMQPFACMPNHISGKGVIKALKAHYPYANITAIDYDPGASEVNQLNRIKLMLAVAFRNVREENLDDVLADRLPHPCPVAFSEQPAPPQEAAFRAQA